MREFDHAMNDATGHIPTRMQNDSAAIRRKRERETRTVSQMVAIHCAGNHPKDERTEWAVCGEPVCPACKALDDYACLRTQHCRRMGEKVSCETCPHHCYAPAMREQIRQVMRYAGPRMLKKHPISAVRHLAGKLGTRKANDM